MSAAILAAVQTRAGIARDSAAGTAVLRRAVAAGSRRRRRRRAKCGDARRNGGGQLGRAGRVRAMCVLVLVRAGLIVNNVCESVSERESERVSE